MQLQCIKRRQERFLNETFTTKSKDIFSDVSMMLFVFDVASEQTAVVAAKGSEA